MGLFTKESRTHFERDKAGNVIKVEHSGDEPKRGLFKSRTPLSDKMEKEYYKEHPNEKKPSMSSKFKTAAKQVDKAIVKYNRRSNPMRGNYNPWGSMFDTGMNYKKPVNKKSSSSTRYAIINNKAYPIAGSKKKKKSSKKKTSYGFDTTDNWGFFK